MRSYSALRMSGAARGSEPSSPLAQRRRCAPCSCLAPLLFTLALSLSACSLNQPDLGYRDSRLLQPLAIPQGLDSPQYSPSMDIPAAGPAVLRNGPEIEQPPDLRAKDHRDLGED